MAISTIGANGLTTPLPAANLGTPSAINLSNATALARAALPTGSVLQVVQANSSGAASTTSSASFVSANLSGSITPISATNKIMVLIMQEIQVWNSSNYATGMWQLLRNSTVIYTPSSTSNGNVFAYDYGGSGINVYRPTPIMWLDSPSTTSSTTYSTQIKLGSNGGTFIGANGNSPGTIILMEIAA